MQSPLRRDTSHQLPYCARRHITSAAQITFGSTANLLSVQPQVGAMLGTVTDWAGMDQELLAHMLQLLPAEDRNYARLACRAWQAAADAATNSISLDRISDAGLEALYAWLPQHGQHLTSLHLQLTGRQRLKQLPCSRLRDLQLRGGLLRLPLIPQTAAACLTRLVLQLQDPGVVLVQLRQELCQLTSLEHLGLRLTGSSARPGNSSATQLTGPELWSSMRSLTYLGLQPFGPAADVEQQLMRLTNLEEIELGYTAEYHRPSTQYLQHLQHLTRLAFSGPVRITPVGSDSLGPLTNLCSLQLDRCSCDASSLVGTLTSLQSLSLKAVEWTAPAAIYRWLVQLTQLTSLAVAGLRELAVAVPDGATTCAALTSSPCLQRLDFSGQLVHRTVWRVMFPAAGRVLQQLQSLQLFSSPVLPLMDAADVRAPAQCCPALKSLQAGYVLPVGPALGSLRHLTCLHVVQASEVAQAGALQSLTSLQQLELRLRHCMKWRRQDLLPLLQLSALTYLSFKSTGEAPAISDTVASMLPKLTQVIRLDVSGMGLSEQQLRPMAYLTALTCLQVSTAAFGVWMVDRLKFESRPLPGISMDNKVILQNKAPPGTAPGVAQRLQACFSPNYRHAQQELARLQKQVAQQQHNNQQLTEQNQQLTAQLAASNSMVADMRQQPTQVERQQQQDEMAALRQQLAKEQAEKQEVQRQLAQLQQWAQQGAALVGQQLLPPAAAPL